MQIDPVRVVGGITAKAKEKKIKNSTTQRNTRNDILFKSIYLANYANGMVGVVVGLIVNEIYETKGK